MACRTDEILVKHRDFSVVEIWLLSITAFYFSLVFPGSNSFAFFRVFFFFSATNWIAKFHLHKEETALGLQRCTSHLTWTIWMAHDALLKMNKLLLIPLQHMHTHTLFHGIGKWSNMCYFLTLSFLKHHLASYINILFTNVTCQSGELCWPARSQKERNVPASRKTIVGTAANK